MRSAWAPPLVVSLLCLACARPTPPADTPLPAARGIVLVTFDALRADRVGAYGYRRATTPFLDALADRRGIVFERAVVSYPATLVSNTTLFTGLYPGEHGVYPPSGVIPSAIETLPEILRRQGFRTAGHTEGGFMAGGYGFARGFEEFTDTPYESETDVERTFERGLDFLRGLNEGERYFLFLHTFVTHDPYDPPSEFRQMLGVGPLPEGAPPPEGPVLRAVNQGEIELDAATLAAWSDQYDASIRYADEVLRRFWSEVEALGLAGETALIVTADHGEELGEHGRVGHTQVYPECLLVPFVVVHPVLEAGRRVPGLAESVRFAPTVLELAGLEPPAAMPRPGLLGELDRHAPASERLTAYAEVIDRIRMRSLLSEEGGGLRQLVVSEAAPDPEGTWISRSASFDHAGDRLAFAAHSFHEPRSVRVTGDGEVLAELTIPVEWTDVAVELPPDSGWRRLALETDSCAAPAELGGSDDDRCLSFQVRDLPLRRVELFDLEADPTAAHDLAGSRPEVRERLLRTLARLRFEPVAPPETADIPPEVHDTLRALGYVD